MRRGGSGSGAGAESGRRAHRRWSIGWAVAIDPVRVGAASSKKRLGPEAVVDEDARGKRRKERYGHDERRFHGHGQTVVSSILPKEVPNHAWFHAWIEMDDPPSPQLFAGWSSTSTSLRRTVGARCKVWQSRLMRKLRWLPGDEDGLEYSPAVASGLEPLGKASWAGLVTESYRAIALE